MVTFCTASGNFDYVCVNGGLQQAKVTDVAFVIRGVYPQLPAKQYDHSLIEVQLRHLIKLAVKRIPQIIPALSVLHAQLAVHDRPRAVGFEFVHRKMKSWNRIPLVSPYAKNVFNRAVSRLSLYLGMAYYTSLFVRLRGSPFVAVSEKTMNSINKVMYEMTQIELEYGCVQLVNGSSIEKYPIACTLRDLLEHYALWNDGKLTAMVEAIISLCEQNLVSLQNGEGESSQLVLGEGMTLFPWLRTRVRDPEENQTGFYSNSRDNQTKLEHNFANNTVIQCTMFDKQTAASYDSKTKTLNIFIPLLQGIQPPLALRSISNLAGRTVKLQSKLVPMLPRTVIDKYAFALRTPRQSLHLSVNVNTEDGELDLKTSKISKCIAMPTVHSFHETSKELNQALMCVEPLVSEHELNIPADEFMDLQNDKFSFEKDDEGNRTDITGEYEENRSANFSNLAPNGSDNMLPSSPVALVHIQSAAGRIAGSYMSMHSIDAPYVVTKNDGEVFSSTPGFHNRILSEAYVPISKPFDSSVSLIIQRILADVPPPRFLYSGRQRPAIVSKMQDTIIPQLKLDSCLENRDFVYWTLSNLQNQIHESKAPGLHIFRCTLLEDGEQNVNPDGQLIHAYCHDLEIEMEVFVPSYMKQLLKGDQVIGTQIIELNPMMALFIVSI